ncbi:uncharacterized protein VNE69_07196 [Vairimorpha necatrix]|uniref:Rab-GAP TBC domain-containing protein n=1 Tax=Vairimorpha necatrix TaxID=6039 RepID=A0AAX4JDN8_9MICR
MENTKFADILKSYESKVEGTSYEIIKKDADEISLINNDVDRTYFLSVNKNEKFKKNFLIRILRDLLNEIPVPYIQGMSEICAVFVFYYFAPDSGKFYAHVKKETEEKTENVEIDDETYKKVKKSLKDKYEKVRIVITNVIIRKYEPLIKDNFKLYKEYNLVFDAMMKRRGIKLKDYESLSYMASVLTFFYRNVTCMEDAYKIYEIILSCPPSTPFLLLVVYYDTISNKKNIESVDDNLYKSVIALEDEFMKILDEIKSGKKCFLKKHAVLIGGAIGFIAAVAAYKYNKRSDE